MLHILNLALVAAADIVVHVPTLNTAEIGLGDCQSNAQFNTCINYAQQSINNCYLYVSDNAARQLCACAVQPQYTQCFNMCPSDPLAKAQLNLFSTLFQPKCSSISAPSGVSTYVYTPYFYVPATTASCLKPMAATACFLTANVALSGCETEQCTCDKLKAYSNCYSICTATQIPQLPPAYAQVNQYNRCPNQFIDAAVQVSAELRATPTPTVTVSKNVVTPTQTPNVALFTSDAKSSALSWSWYWLMILVPLMM